MRTSIHSLHAGVANSPVTRTAASLARKTPREAPAAETLLATAAPATVEIPLKTVSEQGNFDAYIQVALPGAAAAVFTELLVDSGNSFMIFPRWEDIAALPDAADYRVLAEPADNDGEPWGCRGKIVEGPILLPLVAGGTLRLDGCIFFACTEDNADGGRTANFGAASIAPWSANGWAVCKKTGDVMQSPLSYAALPVAEFDFQAAADLFDADGSTQTRYDARLYLHASMPDGYTVMNIRQGSEWMEVAATGLAIDGQPTAWPGTRAAVAVIDTGGTCMFLSDPDDLACKGTYPSPEANPSWVDAPGNASTACQTTGTRVTLALDDGATRYSYTIDPQRLPASARGQTLVLCERNAFMMGEYGVNIGGISMLVNLLAIDYAKRLVGLKAKP